MHMHKTHEHGIMISYRYSICSLVFRAAVIDNRDEWWHSHLTVRGEIIGFVKDELLRKHLPIVFSFIKN